MSVHTAGRLPAAADSAAVASPSEQKEGDGGNVTLSDSGHRISSAISAGLSGVQDVGKLLMRQPSVHLPTRARTPTLTPSPIPTPIFDPLLRSTSPNVVSGNVNGLQGQLSTSSSSTASSQLEQSSAGAIPGALSNVGLQQGFGRQASRLHRGSLKKPLDLQSGISPGPTLQLSLPILTARNSPAVIDASMTKQAMSAADCTATSNKQHQVSPARDQLSSHPALLAAEKPAEQNSTVAGSGVRAAASVHHVTAEKEMSASGSLASSSSKFGKAASVSFSPAADSDQLGAVQTMPSSGNCSMSKAISVLQDSSSKASVQAGVGNGKLARSSSSLAIAVGETMQDRMLAGGMMRRRDEHSLASGNRCVWDKANPVDRCPWPRSTADADSCLWPRSILKKPSSEGTSSGTLGAMGMTVVHDGQASTEALTGSGKGMPMQLSKHRSNLSKASKRSDFAAAMNAVRESWIAEQQIAKPMLDVGNSAQPNGVLQTRAVESDATHQTNFDLVWQSISHTA